MASSLGFYSWMQHGLAAFMDEATEDGVSAGHGPRARARVELLEQRPGATPATRTHSVDVDLDLVSPAHVAGIQPGIVTRVWPKPGVTDAETAYFPLIEFADADFPWRYSPHRGSDVPGGPSARPPWVALVVLGEDEFVYTPAGPNRKLSSITVHAGTNGLPLPPSSELHLWAHAQVSGATIADPAVLQTTLREHPERAVSRLVCPRFLAAKQRYRAFLVPSYRGGAQAGLGQPVTSRLAAAWTEQTTSVELPVYYEWSFLMGDVGSFRELALRLTPRRLSGSGTREMDVSKPGLAELNDKATRVQVGGALRPVDAPAFEWPANERDAWRAAIAPLVNQAEILLNNGSNDPVPKPKLAPPLYGRWYAGPGRIEGGTTPANPRWFQELNEAPHLRVPAALGTTAVQKDQQALMASAWQQVDGLLKLNQQIRQAQLSREASLQSYRRHVRPIPRPGALLQLAGGVLGRVLSYGARTALGTLRKSPVPDGFLDPAWRRLTRPLGALGRRQRRPALPLPAPGHDTVDQLNDGTLDPAPLPLPSPSGAVGPGTGAPGHCPCCLSPEIVDAIVALTPEQVYLLGKVLFLEGKLFAGFGTLFRVALMRIGLMLIEAAATPGGLEAFRNRVQRECTGTVTAEDLDRTPPIGGTWTPLEPVPTPAETPPPPPPEGTLRGETEVAFREAAQALLTTLNATPAPGLVLTRADVPRLVTDIVTALDPRRTIADALRRRLTTLHWTPEDPLEPLLVAPEFPQPMYEPLRDISTDWIMPGISDVQANTLALVLTNQTFVEAYMVGLNHEMGRELLWHEYPNDLRGTYFRHFWDVRGRLIAAGTADGTCDIQRIHRWGDTALGANTARNPLDSLVLFLRGDLLHRYPQVVVYMARTELSPAPARPSAVEKHALFRGKLGGDAGLYGFDLTPPEARGHATSADPGWYVVLQEPHTEPRFGIPETATPPQPGAFLESTDPIFTANLSSALAAQKLYRQPVRVAFQASTMLPPETP